MFSSPRVFELFRHSSVLPLCALLLAVSGCAEQKKPETPIGQSAQYELDAIEEKSDSSPPLAPQVVEQAAREFTGYRLNDERSFDEETFMSLLASADLICIGERHDQPLDHYAQLAVLRGILKRAPMRGVEIGVAFEMVRHDYTKALTSFLEGDATMSEFVDRSAWEKEWGFPIELYAPIFEEAKKHHLAGVALGVRRSTTRAVARSGLDELKPEIKSALPELDLTQDRHRRNFYAMMGGHPGEPGGDQAQMMANYYAAQVVWDEAMAEYSAKWLTERSPVRKLVVFAGTAHCAYSAIPQRTERRGNFVAVSVLPVDGGKPLATSEAPSLPGETKEDDQASSKQEAPNINEFLAADYDFQLIFQ